MTSTLRSLAETLHGVDYSAAALSHLLGATTIYEPDLLAFPFYRRRAANGSPLGAAARLFLLEDPLSREVATALLGGELVDALIDVDVLAMAAGDSVQSVVDVFPVGDLLVATDLVFFRGRVPFDAPTGREVYYVGRDSFDLAEALPRNAVQRVLDLCTGSGVQALCAAARADEVVGVDINPRAVQFARANSLLNGIDNASFFEGDLFAPVAGRRFDLVVANPPFVAAPVGTSTLYRDGGALGDDVLLALLNGLSDYLAPDGEAYVITQFVRRPDEADVLGAALGGTGFDVLIVDLAQYDARAFVTYHAHRALLRGGWAHYSAEVERWLNHVAAHDIETLSYSIVAVRRAPSFRLTRRTVPGAATARTSSAAHVIGEWRSRAAGPGLSVE